MDVKRVGVVGAGQMGGGIAYLLITHGIEVVLVDEKPMQLEKAFSKISLRLTKEEKKGTISNTERQKCLSRVKTTHQLKHLAEVDLVIEAIVEKMETKAALFRELDHLTADHTVLASNTSALSITALAAHTARAERVIGMHFMNPVHVMPLVEVIRGLLTSDEVFATIFALAQKWGKQPVVVQDFPGFVSNRLLMPMINEAVYVFQERVATAEAIDQVMKLGMNHPMGPLALADLIGLDTCLQIMESLQQGLGDSKYRPCPLLRRYVQAGWLGKKVGRGFYQYDI